MSRTMILRPFFVFVLPVLALFLVWQDVSAQGTEKDSRSRRQAEATPAPASTHIPTSSMSALNGLALNAGRYAAWVAACDDPATIKHDFLAAADALDPDDKAHVIYTFDTWYASVFSRTNSALEMRKNPNPRSSGASDPCTEAVGNEYREQYEHDLLSAQKLAATESAAAAPTSPAAPSQESSVTEWSLPPLPASHATSQGFFERTYQDCLRREKGSNPNYEETCQCRANNAVSYLKKNPTHSFQAVSYTMMSGCKG